MSDLLALADRVQDLTSACRETDLAIMQATSGHPWRWADSRTFEPQTVITWDQYGADAPGNPFYTLEEFTASIDAAMTLARNNREAMVMMYAAHRSFEHIEMDETPNLFPRIKAMLAWNLRARAALENSHG
jgi:hypothetical protein